jgi:hypothetical protein
LFTGMGEAAGFGGSMKYFELVPIHLDAFYVTARQDGRLLGRHICRDARLGLAMRGKKFLGFERRHAAEPGCGNRLAINVVGDIAGGE